MNVPRDIKHEGWCTFPTLYQPITGKRVDSNGEVYNIADHYQSLVQKTNGLAHERVTSPSSDRLLLEILAELQVMNLHLQQITGEKIDADRRRNRG